MVATGRDDGQQLIAFDDVDRVQAVGARTRVLLELGALDHALLADEQQIAAVTKPANGHNARGALAFGHVHEVGEVAALSGRRAFRNLDDA